jgi:hypothetical protein
MQPSAKQISNHKYKSTIKGRAAVLMSNARQRCIDKGIELELTTEWVISHLERGTCELTGIEFNLSPPPDGISRRPDAPSLDRIDKDKQYTTDNTRVILWAVNCALSEYGTETILPILKAMVAGIENAKEKSITPISKGNNSESTDNTQYGIVSAPWTWQDNDYPYSYSGTICGQDFNHSPQASGGDSLGFGSKEVGTSQAPTRIENNGQPDAEIVRLEFGSRYLFGEP